MHEIQYDLGRSVWTKIHTLLGSHQLFNFSNTTWSPRPLCWPAMCWRRRTSSGQMSSKGCPSLSERWELIRFIHCCLHFISLQCTLLKLFTFYHFAVRIVYIVYILPNCNTHFYIVYVSLHCSTLCLDFNRLLQEDKLFKLFTLHPIAVRIVYVVYISPHIYVV